MICRPQTTLWGGPRPRFEPGMGDLEKETLTTWPQHLLFFVLNIFLLRHFIFKATLSACLNPWFKNHSILLYVQSYSIPVLFCRCGVRRREGRRRMRTTCGPGWWPARQSWRWPRRRSRRSWQPRRCSGKEVVYKSPLKSLGTLTLLLKFGSKWFKFSSSCYSTIDWGIMFVNIVNTFLSL